MNHSLLTASGRQERERSRIYPHLERALTDTTGQTIPQWLRHRLDNGTTWDQIVADFAELTGTTIHRDTFLRWHPEFLTPKAKGRRITRLLAQDDQ